MPTNPSGSYPAKPAVAVGAVVFHQRRVLLVKRSKAPSLGVWAIPGGSVELGETLQQAAEREILEETGITIRAGEPIFCFDAIEREASGRVKFHYVITDVLADYVAGEPIANDDALDARWVAAEELDDLNVSEITLELLGNRLCFGV